MGGGLLLGGLAAPALAACGESETGGGEGNISLTVGYNTAAEYPHGAIIEHFVELLTEQTNGELDSQTFPNATLGDETKMLEGIRLGTLDLAKAITSVLASVVPQLGALDLPYLFRDKAHMFAVLNGPIGADLLAQMESAGLKGLLWLDQGTRNFYTVDTPIRELADLQGLKIRAIEAPVMVDTINALGALATPMPFSELYVALQTHVVDGAENSPDAIASAKHYEVCRHYAESAHFRTPCLLYMSMERWDGLSADLQDAITTAATQAGEWGADLYEEEAVAGIATMTEAGMEITSPDLEEFRLAVQPVYDQHVEAIGADLVESIRAA
jgi:tripartite ATP-independent transporter DctP family solute receptor